MRTSSARLCRSRDGHEYWITELRRDVPAGDPRPVFLGDEVRLLAKAQVAVVEMVYVVKQLMPGATVVSHRRLPRRRQFANQHMVGLRTWTPRTFGLPDPEAEPD